MLSREMDENDNLKDSFIGKTSNKQIIIVTNIIKTFELSDKVMNYLNTNLDTW